MKRNSRWKDVTKSDLIQELDAIINEYKLPNITQKEYFSLSKFSEFIMRRLGINFSELKNELGLSNNIKGRKVRSGLIKAKKSKSNLEFTNPIKLEHTGKLVRCLKRGKRCSGTFKQSNLLHHVCANCYEENKRVTESAMYW